MAFAEAPFSERAYTSKYSFPWYRIIMLVSSSVLVLFFLKQNSKVPNHASNMKFAFYIVSLSCCSSMLFYSIYVVRKVIGANQYQSMRQNHQSSYHQQCHQTPVPIYFRHIIHPSASYLAAYTPYHIDLLSYTTLSYKSTNA
jgi:uncharacterized protein with PQ loop repeat